jgi:hypothetical protein
MAANSTGRRHCGGRAALVPALVFLCLLASRAEAQSKNLADGFSVLPQKATVVIMPTDIELFSISAGGILEPKADWTEAASRYFKSALSERKSSLGVATVELTERDADELAEINALHAAIARSVSLHHFGPSSMSLPTKAGKLDWSLGEVVRTVREKTKADYALFSWVRDSYVSGERVATMIALALFGIGVPGGQQIGYASLIDLETGRIVWFNRLLRATGDLREQAKAAETVNALLENFPSARQ